MQLVLLAAGHGRRFGGLKQLASVGPNGEAIMDYTALSAHDVGFDSVVLIVREEVREELLEHIGARWPGELSVVPVVQGEIAGTAQAVASAASSVDASFGVANADDLYGDEAFATLVHELGALGESGEHVIVGYRLADTIIGDSELTRGLCRTDDEGYLVEIVEHKVRPENNGFFIARPLGSDPQSPGIELTGDEIVSMNLWGFSPGIFAQLESALASFDPESVPTEEGKPPELLLPSVVGELVAAGQARVKVVMTKGRCIGITHPDDLDLVREMISSEA
jgi:hypothetical protein